MRITAVIPTRNRAEDLCRTVVSILQQTVPPDELLIIDQSADEVPRARVQALFESADTSIRLRHVLDPSIAGLVEAKHVAAGLAAGDLVLFLEDDVVLRPDYIAQMARGFEEHPHLMGCCGVVEAVAVSSPLYRRFFALFHRGIFHDERTRVHGNLHAGLPPMIQSRFLSGGVSAWRREVLAQVPFDLENGFFALEDIDYSTRAVRAFGETAFCINTRAVLDHRMSPANRAQTGARYRRKLREFLTFYKKNRDLPWAQPSLAWLLLGLFAESLVRSAQLRTLLPLQGYWQGLRDGIRRPLASGPAAAQTPGKRA